MGVWDYRALNSTELTRLESDGQSTRLGLAIQPISEVWRGRVATTPTSTDSLVEIEWSSGVGSYSDILVDSTLLIGTSQGAYDIGMARIRAPADASKLYIGEISDVPVQANHYLMVIDEFGLWPRHVRIIGEGDDFEVRMDWDVAYSDQHKYCRPVMVMGPDVVVKLTGSSVDVTCFDASESWVLGGTKSAYAWTAPGSSALSGETTANPTITYDTPGWYRVSCEITTNESKTFTGHRNVFVYNDANPPVWVSSLDGCEGDRAGGGWSFRVTAHEGVGLSALRNRAKVILFAEDVYGTYEGSVGVVTGRENILAMGWVCGESIRMAARTGDVQFEVQGPQWWMACMLGFPSGVEDCGDSTDPDNWLEFRELTVERAMYHYWVYRTTGNSCLDFMEPQDRDRLDTPIGLFTSGLQMLWEQINEACQRSVRAQPCFDHLGRLYVECPTNLLVQGDRSSVPVTMDVDKNHWREAVQFRRQIVSPVGQIDLAGVVWDSGDLDGMPLFSLSPGHVMKRHGGVQQEDHLALETQAGSNLLAGLILGQAINPYPSILVRFGMNCRVWEIVPHLFGRITVEAGDTPRGIVLTNHKITAQRVSYSWAGGADGGALLVDVDFTGETTESTHCDGDVPANPPGPGPPPGPPDPPPPPQKPPLDKPGTMIIFDRCHILLTTNLQGSSPTWDDVKGVVDGVILAVKWGTDSESVWCLTGSHGSEGNDQGTGVGVWHCPDIFAGSPAWTLKFSQYQAYSHADRDPGEPGAPYYVDASWGQLRSLWVNNAGVFAAEAKWEGILSPATPEIGGKGGSTVFQSTDGGSSWSGYNTWCFYHGGYAEPFLRTYGNTCANDANLCWPNNPYIRMHAWVYQYLKFSCHQLLEDAYGAINFVGLLRYVAGEDMCSARKPDCNPPYKGDFVDHYAWPAQFTNWTDTDYKAMLGVQVGSTAVAITDGGKLVFGLQIVEEGLTTGQFGGLSASLNYVYYCQPKPERGNYVNRVARRNLWGSEAPFAAIYSDDLFWEGTSGDRSAIGYIGAWPSSVEGLVIIRKDKWGGNNSNRSVVYWWDQEEGLLDKTGDLETVLGSNGWSGTGHSTLPGDAWNGSWDNVGAACFEARLP
jgi:hypothetical protein